MANSVVEPTGFDFAVRTANLYKRLNREKERVVLSKQLLRFGISIGANVSKAECGRSKADFTAKISAALKEANETFYWIKFFYKTGYLTKRHFSSLEIDISETIKILISICKSSNK